MMVKKASISNTWLWRMGYTHDYGSREKNEAVYGGRKKQERDADGHGKGDQGVKVFAPRGESFDDAKHALKHGLGSGLFKDKMRTGRYHKKAGGTGVLR